MSLVLKVHSTDVQCECTWLITWSAPCIKYGVHKGDSNDVNACRANMQMWSRRAEESPIVSIQYTFCCQQHQQEICHMFIVLIVAYKASVLGIIDRFVSSFHQQTAPKRWSSQQMYRGIISSSLAFALLLREQLIERDRSWHSPDSDFRIQLVNIGLQQDVVHA